MADQISTIQTAKFTVETAPDDGTPVHMRPVKPGDKHIPEVGMEHLSKESRYFRFFSPESMGDTVQRAYAHPGDLQ